MNINELNHLLFYIHEVSYVSQSYMQTVEGIHPLIESNKYRAGISEAITSSSLIVPLFMMLIDDALPSKTTKFDLRI